MKNRIMYLFIIHSVINIFALDNFPAAFKHPGNLPVDSIPQFICYGFDDNCFLDGLTWAESVFASRKNPDGKPIRATFFISTHPEIENKPLWDKIGQMYKEGHEIANHTQRHDNEIFSANLGSKDLWNKEISGATSDLGKQSNVPKSAIVGFRVPFLLYSGATYECMMPNGILYDCSVEQAFRQFLDQTTQTYYNACAWPYTLDNGVPTNVGAVAGSAIGKIPGLWELPVYNFFDPDNIWQGITGLDYNIWIRNQKSKEEAIRWWKHSLDLRLKGYNQNNATFAANRTPFFIGMHSDEYSAENTEPELVNANAKLGDRRAAVTEFLDFALTYNPAIRVVPYIEVIKWMRNPVPYSQYHFDPVTSTVVPVVVKKSSAGLTAAVYLKMIVLNLPAAGVHSINIYDLSGSMIANLGTISCRAGKNDISFNKDLPAGLYMLKISGVAGSVKIVKK